jgi:serpin B
VWGKAGVVPADYAKRISSFGEVRPLPSEPDKAAAAVNAWATGQTKGRVTELAEPEDAAGGAVVTSVVYFKGAWWKPFDAAKPGVFHGARGDVTAAPMMSLKDTFGYVEDATLQAAALPYRGTPEYVMLIILPRPGKREAAEKALEGDGLRKLLDAMDVTDKMRKDHEDAVTKILEQESDPADSSAPDSKERGERIFARFQAAGAHVPRRKLTLTLPRFEIQSKFDLVDALRAAGARRVFNGGQAQLGGIAPGMALGRVRQVAWIKVDETGTEGAAATAGGLFGGQFPIPEATMVVDRPFLFAVVAQTARVPLFAGRVEDVKGM